MTHIDTSSPRSWSSHPMIASQSPSELVLTVPSELLEGKTEKEKAAFTTSYLSFMRLKKQQDMLTDEANKTVQSELDTVIAVKKEKSMGAVRKRSTLRSKEIFKVKVPKILQKSTEEKKRKIFQPLSPEKEVIPIITTTKTIPQKDKETTIASAAQEEVAALKAASPVSPQSPLSLKALETADSVPAATTTALSPYTPSLPPQEGQEEDENDVQRRYDMLSTVLTNHPTTLLSSSFADENGILVKPISPSERIGILYTPTANVRTNYRNAQMAIHQTSYPPPTLSRMSSSASGKEGMSALGSVMDTMKSIFPGKNGRKKQVQKGVLGKDPELSHFIPADDFLNYDADIIFHEVLRVLKNEDNKTKNLANDDIEKFLSSSLSHVIGGRSRYYDPLGNETWLPCRVISYNPESMLFTIFFQKTLTTISTTLGTMEKTITINPTVNIEQSEENFGQTESQEEERTPSKPRMLQATRLNLIFDDEDETLWKQRVAEAMTWRDETEAKIRYHLYIDGIEGGNVGAIDQNLVDRVLGLVAQDFPIKHLNVISKSIEEVEKVYSYALKNAYHKYQFLSKAEQKRLIPLNIQKIPLSANPLEDLVLVPFSEGNPAIPLTQCSLKTLTAVIPTASVTTGTLIAPPATLRDPSLFSGEFSSRDSSFPQRNSQQPSITPPFLHAADGFFVATSSSLQLSMHFQKAKEFIDVNLFQTHPLLQMVIYSIHAQWSRFENQFLCYVSTEENTKEKNIEEQMHSSPDSSVNANSTEVTAISVGGGVNVAKSASSKSKKNPCLLPAPCELKLFACLQEELIIFIVKKLNKDWIDIITILIQNELCNVFDFYMSNIKVYESSRIKRFLNVINAMLRSQLRKLMVESLEKYVGLLCSYSPQQLQKGNMNRVKAITQKFEDRINGEDIVNAANSENNNNYENDQVHMELPEDVEEREFWKKHAQELIYTRTAIIAQADEEAAAAAREEEKSRKKKKKTTTGGAGSSGSSLKKTSQKEPSLQQELSPISSPLNEDEELKSLLKEKPVITVADVMPFPYPEERVEFSSEIVKMARYPSDKQPLLVIRLTAGLGGTKVQFQPLLEEVEDVLKSVFMGIFTKTNILRGIQDQLFVILQLPKLFLCPLDEKNDPFVIEQRTKLNHLIKESFEAPIQLQKMYANAFEYILNTDSDTFIGMLDKKKFSLLEYDACLNRLERDISRIISRTVDEVQFDFIKVVCTDLKQSLVQKSMELIHSACSHLSSQTKNKLTEIISGYEAILDNLIRVPKTPEELQELKNYADGPAKQALITLENDFMKCTDALKVLEKYKYITDSDVFYSFWKGFGIPKTVEEQLTSMAFKCKNYRIGFQEKLTHQCEELLKNINQLAEDVADFENFYDEKNSLSYYERIVELIEVFKNYDDQITLYNSQENLFGQPLTNYTHIREIKQIFFPFKDLWETWQKFSSRSEEWMAMPIEDLNIKEIDQLLLQWMSKANTVFKKLQLTGRGGVSAEGESGEKGSGGEHHEDVEHDEKTKDGDKKSKQQAANCPLDVAKHLKENVAEFKELQPLMIALRSNLQAVHWKQILNILVSKPPEGGWEGGIPPKPPQIINPEQNSLTEFVNLGMMVHLTAIEEIAEMARKTYALENDLSSMEADWNKLLFELEVHDQTYRLKSSEIVQQLLDDHIIRTQSLLGKPIIRQGLAPSVGLKAHNWAKLLNRIQITLDEWFRCQMTWSYLEPIFSSADISKAMPVEASKFFVISTSWHKIMESTRLNPLITSRILDESLLQNLQSHNATLEEILKKLHAFLETKMMAFPRFYFISNEELLQILSDSKDPFLVQPYLAKCFEGIKRIQFEDNLDIVAMLSAENEVIPFVKKINPSAFNNQVEVWLQTVETTMAESIRDQLRLAREDYAQRKRIDFIRKWPGQCVIVVCSLYWTSEASTVMDDEGTPGLVSYHQKCNEQIDDLIILVRDKGLKPVERATLEALVVIEVHARDIIGELANNNVSSSLAFDWLAQLRYYWTEDDQLDVCQINAQLRYGYEYLGNTGRLVITQLTDRCYRTLMGALNLNYGGAPEGPAGTGKTETTKDLAKSLGKYCVVYNCTDQITAKDMAKLFKGLAQSGSWGCFDEFNRIEIQVLSVIAQQVATIQESIALGKVEFLFEGVQIKLKQGCAVFITMNPGYAGRAELPDNLKALFRPVAMMVPNYAMIGQIQLFSYGFLHGKELAEKIVATYRLCSEQLSSQDHYDYGMRAVKAVLTAAGRLKHQFPNEDESILMLRSIQDVNVPKFLAQDVDLFKGIIADLFPGIVLPQSDYVALTNAIERVCSDDNLQPTEYFLSKCFQTYEMILVRHGMMLVGFSYGGKTATLRTLSQALTLMSTEKLEMRTQLVSMNPKSITMAQLYGSVDASGEWTDGILSNKFRSLAADTPDRKWLVLDGPVDAVWIENMNTVLDDNKKLCLQNGDIIPMSKQMNMIFEVQDLAHASPATVSRCGMVYVEPETMGWNPLISSYKNILPLYISEHGELLVLFDELIQGLMVPMLEHVRKNCTPAIPQGASVVVASFIRLLGAQLRLHDEQDETMEFWVGGKSGGNDILEGDEFQEEVIPIDENCLKSFFEACFIFALTWSVGGALYAKDRHSFSQVLYNLLSPPSEAAGAGKKKNISLSKEKGKITSSSQAQSKEFIKLSISINAPDSNLSFYDGKYEYCAESKEVRFISWSDTLQEFNIPETAEYQSIIVPTTDTAKYSFLLDLLISAQCYPLLIGGTGTGKSIMVKKLLSASFPKDLFILNLIQFSAQTSANNAQRLIDSKCERKRKGIYGPGSNKRMLIFIDDVNMPQLETYGAQPPIELVRQWHDHNGWYNHMKDDIDFRRVEGIQFIAAMGPPGGGRNPVTQRYTRHYNALVVPVFDDATLKKIFGTLVDWIITKGGYPSNLRNLGPQLVDATCELYELLVEKLKPTPEKSHYTFNLRDVSKVFQGIKMANAARIQEPTAFYRLWLHEIMRCFADRFVEQADTDWFINQMKETIIPIHFKTQYKNLFNAMTGIKKQNGGGGVESSEIGASTIIFAELLNDRGFYDEIEDLDGARRALEEKLDVYNCVTRTGTLDLVIFNYVIEHVTRISRILKQPQGSALLIGVGGSGRHSCTKLSAYCLGHHYVTITVTKGYKHSDFHDSIRSILLKCGSNVDQPITFCLSDTQFVESAFLEDICSLLNSGEVPGIFDTKQDQEALDSVVSDLKDLASKDASKEILDALFVSRCKKFLHIVLCFSPIGRTLRDWLRQFPSLISCTTIDWYHNWPMDGLNNVASRLLSDVEGLEDDPKLRDSIRECFVTYHQDVRALGVVYLEECRQNTYVTPTSYLELLKAFRSLLCSKRKELMGLRQRYEGGRTQLKKTEEFVAEMKEELAIMLPKLEKKAKETAELIFIVEKESAEAENVRAKVAVEEADANKIAEKAKEVKDRAQSKVAEAKPKLEAAKKAAESLDNAALAEVKQTKKVMEGSVPAVVIEGLCKMLGDPYLPKPMRDPMTGKVGYDYFGHSLKTLLTASFKSTLANFANDMDNQATDANIVAVEKMLSLPSFEDKKVARASIALLGISGFIKNMVEYYSMNKIVKPLLKEATEAQAEFDSAVAKVEIKQEELRLITEKLTQKQEQLRVEAEAKAQLEAGVADTQAKITRAVKLIDGLGGEKVRYQAEAARYEDAYTHIIGDVILASGMIAYLGPFQARYRQKMLKKWISLCQNRMIPFSEGFTLEKFLGDPIALQNWKLQQLPSDAFSVENAIIMSNSLSYPLMIDPQQQANRWIKNMERENNLQIVRPTDSGYTRVIARCVTDGLPCLLENVPEELDPQLENLLLKNYLREGNALTVTIDEAVEWNPNFRLYITTKLPRPHYQPEVSTKVALINFLITEGGLQDQLLQHVMLSERREVEERKKCMTIETAQNKASLKATEDTILRLLSGSGSLLDNEEAIIELDRSKHTSDKVSARQKDIEEMDRISEKTRQQFVPVAKVGAKLFFCVAELANVDPMYQYSLQYYIALFTAALRESATADEVAERIENIIGTFQKSLYCNICRSLFAKDQLLFSFIMCLKLLDVDPISVRWLCAPTMCDINERPNIFKDWLPDVNWSMLVDADRQLAPLKGIVNICKSNEAKLKDFYKKTGGIVERIETSDSWGNEFGAHSEESSRLNSTFNQYESSLTSVTMTESKKQLPHFLENYTGIDRLIVIRCLFPDKVVPAVSSYVQSKLGKFFIEPPLFNLEQVCDELSQDPWTVIVFVLSPGADPNSELDRVAAIKGVEGKKLCKLSLGQGQDAPARGLINEGKRQGNWVLLQNCHLYRDFMGELGHIIEEYSREDVKNGLHKDFRLFLTSLPSEDFPVSTLQNGVKLVQEPPKGLKHNLLRSYTSDPIANPHFFETCDKSEAFKKLLFGLAFFHSVVQERRRFGPLGWNIPYEFNDTDMRISVQQLHMFLDENDEIPYAALSYLIGQCNYGGRVTDDWDRRCLVAILDNYLTDAIVKEDNYLLCSEYHEYFVPYGGYKNIDNHDENDNQEDENAASDNKCNGNDGIEMYVKAIQELPMTQPPDVFGLHANADLSKDERDAKLLMQATLATQPRESGAANSDEDYDKPAAAVLDPKKAVAVIAKDIYARLPEIFDIEAVADKYPITYSQSMNTVLLQELSRFNRLLLIIRKTLFDLGKAIKGEIVMNTELEQVFNAIYDAKVPDVWKKRSYPSLKPFGSYIVDLIARLNFFHKWIEKGPPPVFWVTGFFFTQSFFTGVMQNFARRHRIEIDKLIWNIKVLTEEEGGLGTMESANEKNRQKVIPAPSVAPKDGCYIHGLFLEGAGWNSEMGVLVESKPKELFTQFPIIYLKPITSGEAFDASTYQCPTYKTTDRRGILSTTGHSTNFIMVIELPRRTNDSENHWVLRGTALFTQLDY